MRRGIKAGGSEEEEEDGSFFPSWRAQDAPGLIILCSTQMVVHESHKVITTNLVTKSSEQKVWTFYLHISREEGV